MDGRTIDVAMALLGHFARFAAKHEPEVAMRLIGVAHDWARETGIPAARLNEAIVSEKPLLIAEITAELRRDGA